MDEHELDRAKRDLWEAISYDRPVACIQDAVARGASLSEFGENILGMGERHLCPPICRAAEIGSIEVIDALLAAGASLEQTDFMGETPLHLAARERNIDAAIHLIDLGAEVDARDHENRSPLYWLAMMTDPESPDQPETIKPIPPLARILLERGADGRARFTNGHSAFDFCPSWTAYSSRLMLEEETVPAVAPSGGPIRF